jgi:hypothetical protein
MDEKKQKAYRNGTAVFVLLMILTIGEFLVGRFAPVFWTALMGIGIIKAFFVVRDYMHIGRVFAGDEESEA